MARTVVEDAQLSSYSLRSWVRVLIFGAFMGLVYWLLTLAIGNWVIEPFACRNMSEAVMCVDAVPIAGKIAAVLTAAIAIAGMIRLGVIRPVLVAAGAAAVLWELASYTMGLGWLEATAWTVGLYVLAYALFGWLARASSTVVAVISTVLVAVIICIALVV